MIDFSRTPNVPYGPEGLDTFIDIYSYLLGDRIIVIPDIITRKSSVTIISQILYLESKDSKNDIRIYINCPGGSMNSTLAIYDTMCYVKSPIRTVGIGECYSGASLILAAGTKGKRSVTANSIIMLHEPQVAWEGSATDSAIYHEHVMRSKEKVIEIYQKCTNRNYEQLKKDLERDTYIYPKEALEYGLIDEILGEE